MALIDSWLSALSDAAYLASAELAAEKGSFPLFDAHEFLNRPFTLRLPQDVRSAIAKNGIRNGLLTSIAPTGTISLLAGNVSSGIEPVFAYTYTRRVLQPDGTHTTETVEDYAYRAFRARFGAEAALPDYFVTAQTIAPEDHLAVQAAAQRHIDSSISKTINVPASISFEDFKDVYARAYELGCKGCTTYRPNAVTGAVLEDRGARRRGARGAGARAGTAPAREHRRRRLHDAAARPAGRADRRRPTRSNGWTATTPSTSR